MVTGFLEHTVYIYTAWMNDIEKFAKVNFLICAEAESVTRWVCCDVFYWLKEDFCYESTLIECMIHDFNLHKISMYSQATKPATRTNDI